MKTQDEIFNSVKSIIPENLWDQYNHLSFGEMAEIDELEPWANELAQAEADWFSADN